MNYPIRLPCAIVFLIAAMSMVVADEQIAADGAKVGFFENRIRPVLVKHCYECHSAGAKEIKGGLLVDSRNGLIVGGDSGAAIVPGEPDESLLIQALRHESLEMPPDQKLADEVIADFSQWIRDGAADPRIAEVTHAKREIDVEQGRQFWCFRPVPHVQIPEVDSAWATTDVDRFIVAQQMKSAINGQSVVRAAEATPEALIRRLTFVLTGLPPTLDEQDEFILAWTEDSNAAMESTVDRLLASPRFGEHWGRHWLDVARFSESTGGGRSLMLPDAWRFRDYVIRSFNSDKPFDQLAREHIAGDLLPFSSDEQHDDQLTGVGYLMLGAINYEEQDKEQLRMDVVDEQIESMGRSFLGMTLGCCRCHDHKFDPIPTTDYYALAGIFRSTKSLLPGNVSEFVTAPLRVGYDKFALDAWTARDKELEQQIAALKKIVQPGTSVSRGVSKMPNRDDLAGVIIDDSEATFEGEWTESKFQQPFVGDGYQHSGHGQPRSGLAAHYETKLPNDGEYVVRMVINPGESRSGSVPVLIVHADGESIVTVSQKTAPPGDGVFAELGRFRFESAMSAKVTVRAAEATPGYVIVDAIQFVESVALDGAGTKVASRPKTVEPDAEKSEALDDHAANLEKRLKTLEAERAAHKRQKPEIPIAMCVRDDEQPADWHVHVRGEIRNLGAVVPRGFITVATNSRQSAAIRNVTSSGRLELANWIASPANPLTARVYVNRVWQNVMGEGLVRTPDNFGETGLRPTHPELLDYLADSFVRNDGWSTQKLIRRLCLTSAFRMASEGQGETGIGDPENILLARAFRRRLEAEAVRDALLQISGRLDLSVQSGRTIGKLSTYDNEYHHAEHPAFCRSVYVPSFRNTMLDLFEVFDVANPNIVTGKRTRSTRPAQSLYMLNSPFVMDQAQQATAMFLKSSAFHVDDISLSVDNAWRICLGRIPSDAEAAAAIHVVNQWAGSEDAWSSLFHSLFASVDFRFLD
ncbi:MAG TPA: DUF1553 domain-containing protein [Planctomycetaceae bacterium]|nr:DUF1553 domain-containing protein [Planctomycetaceae bacterium]